MTFSVFPESCIIHPYLFVFVTVMNSQPLSHLVFTHTANQYLHEMKLPTQHSDQLGLDSDELKSAELSNKNLTVRSKFRLRAAEIL